MTIKFITNINEIDKSKALLLIDSSLQAYEAFSKDQPEKCQTARVKPPDGYDLVDSWTGFDTICYEDDTLECYGVVFRSKVAPYTYIFAFRGTSSIMDILDDLGAELSAFVPHHAGNSQIPGDVAVESGFFDVYTTSHGDTASMKSQLFSLIDGYNASDKPISNLFITGHSLGAALCELFTLDVALSRPSIVASNYNYACPRVGNSSFVTFYEAQAAQQSMSTRTLRVQNIYDKVPCVPLEAMGYEHTNIAFLVAFYEQSWSGLEEYNLLDRHSALNYRAVLSCAANSSSGVCIDEKLYVPRKNESVTSLEPDPGSVCSFW